MTSPKPQPSQLAIERGWARYTNAVLGFSVELPTAPVESATSTPTLLGPIDVITVTAQLSTTRSLKLVATTYPARIFQIDDLGGLNLVASTRDTLLRGAPTRGLSERVVMLGSSPGREMLVPPGADGFFLRARLFVVGSTIFTFELRDTQAPLDAADANAAADRFFGSFERGSLQAPVAEGWQPMSLNDAFCSLWLPGTPTKTLRKVETSAGPLDRITYTLDRPERGLHLAVSATAYSVSDLSDGVAAVQAELDRARDSVILELMGSHMLESPTYYGEVRGRELRMDTPDGGYAIVRQHLLGSVLYEQVLRSSNPVPAPAEGRPSIPSGDEVGRFFLTFEPQP